jgi:leucyl/phenylalanyl-tRNA--protein transferase
MKPLIYQLNPFDHSFPPASKAIKDPNGLLAFGGDLSVQRLLNAYHNGIFPWYSDGEPLMWWSPDPRGILRFDDLYINRSFAKFLKKNPYTLSVNKAFESVISYCSSVPRGGDGTWITPEMTQAYIQLHQQGHAHSIEVWDDNELVGGLYGVLVGSCFCGESMFHLKSNASRVAYWGLVNWLKEHGGQFIDCQMQNDFLATLGVCEIPRELYLKQLTQAKQILLPKSMWIPQMIKTDSVRTPNTF